MQTQFKLSHAREILEPCGVLGDYLNLDERGVWPAIERDPLLLPETEGLRWRPARELQHLPDAPEVNDTPMLPNPFNVRELAAFMLEGVGAVVADFYGDWSDGPDPDRLSAIDPDSNARRAVTEAFVAYRDAIAKVGKWDEAAVAHRDAAHKAYWKSSNDKALSKTFSHAQAAWDAAYQTWLTAMVRCLLEHQAVPELQSRAVQVVAAPHSIKPPPLTTSDIAFCFDGIRWSDAEWRKPLGDKPKWLKSCVAIPAQRGVSETRWNPVLIGAALLQNGHAQDRTIRARFQTKPLLMPWLEAWKTYEADNIETP